MEETVMNTAEERTPTPVRRAERLSCMPDELVERARSLAAGGTRRILGITGAPGAGKSTMAQAIAEALGGQAALVGMDAFHLANQVLAAHSSWDRKGAPDTFDPWGYANLLHRLKSNREPVVYAPVFDRSLEESVGSAVPVPREVPLIITEGNYLLLEAEGWRESRELLDQVWYLDVDQDERQRRLVRRHEAFGKPHAEAEAWALGSDQRNADVVDATRERADLIINLTGTYRPETNARL
jgi:pantothenate kinase